MGVHWFWSIAAVAWLAVPSYLALRTDARTREFQGQAFGHFRKAARNLRWLVWAIFAYYVGVVVSAVLLGDVVAMFRYPMPAEGVLTYVRIGAVIAGYVFTHLVAKELYLVTRPETRPLPGDLERV